MKLFISDLDGTLLNSLPAYYRAVVNIFHCYEIEPPTLDDYRDNITPDFMPFYWDRGIPLYVKSRDLNRIKEVCFKECWAATQLHSGAKELLLQCRKLGFDIFIATAETYEIGNRRLCELGLKNLILGWARNGDSRLDDIRDILAFASGFEEGAALEIWYMDDTASGIMAAKDLELGIHTIGFTGGFNSPGKLLASNPDHLVESLSEVPQILKTNTSSRNSKNRQLLWSVR
jgi:phosphoglycolate phosphatase-like HAD superfamily hydrolase